MIIKNHLPQAAEPLVVDAATRGRRHPVDTATRGRRHPWTPPPWRPPPVLEACCWL